MSHIQNDICEGPETPSNHVLVTKKGYMIFGSTNCSCCKTDNFIQGLFDTDEEALEKAMGHEKYKTVCSQYSNTGVYTVREVEYEEIPGDRVIIGGYVFTKPFYVSGHVANALEQSGKEIVKAGK